MHENKLEYLYIILGRKLLEKHIFIGKMNHNISKKEKIMDPE